MLVAVGGAWVYILMNMVDIYNVLSEPGITAGEVRAEVANVIKQTIGGGMLAGLISVIGGITIKLVDEKPESPTVPADVHMALIAILSEEHNSKPRDMIDKLKAAVEELESDA